VIYGPSSALLVFFCFRRGYVLRNRGSIIPGCSNHAVIPADLIEIRIYNRDLSFSRSRGLTGARHANRPAEVVGGGGLQPRSGLGRLRVAAAGRCTDNSLIILQRGFYAIAPASSLAVSPCPT
jgi:hypothetical protein